MPLYIDIHEIAGATPEDVAEAHCKDMSLQDKYGVNYIKYWFNEGRGKIFCMCTAPNAEAAAHVHVAAHGMAAERIIEVDPDMAEGLLGGGAVSATGAATLPSSAGLDPGVRTIVFTDIVGSTAITQRLGDHAAMEVVELHDRVTRAALSRTGGREVKHTGDGIMAAFTSAKLAIRCASYIHKELATAHVAGEAVRVRIGAAAGEPVERNGDFFGSTVQLAARLCAQAQPAQTLVSGSVIELCDGIRFQCVGEVVLKGFAEGMRAHAVAE